MLEALIQYQIGVALGLPFMMIHTEWNYWCRSCCGEAKVVGGFQAQNINGSVVFNGLAIRSIVDREFGVLVMVKC